MALRTRSKMPPVQPGTFVIHGEEIAGGWKTRVKDKDNNHLRTADLVSVSADASRFSLTNR